VCIKPYPAVATAIAAVSAAIALHSRCRHRVADIARIVVHLPAYALGTPSGHPERRYPASKESADHSFYYCVAVALLDGACDEEQFTPQKIADPSLRPLLACTELLPEASFERGWPGAAGGAVSVHLRDGTVLHERRDAPPGHPDNPLPAQALAAKFQRHAEPVLGSAGAARLRQQVQTLEDCPDLREFSRALHAGHDYNGHD
jgi:2-methylcitrate dehydratase